jgi:hypothetical protein
MSRKSLSPTINCEGIDFSLMFIYNYHLTGGIKTMKTKSLNKKLTLSKQTIVNLGDTEMNHIAGGTAVNPVPVQPIPAPVVPVQTMPCTVNQTNCVVCPTNCAWMTSCHTCWPTCG